MAYWRESFCGTCDCFAKVTKDEGECRLNPPQVTTLVSSEIDIIETSKGDQEMLVVTSVVESFYPPVTDDTPACARYTEAPQQQSEPLPLLDPEPSRIGPR